MMATKPITKEEAMRKQELFLQLSAPYFEALAQIYANGRVGFIIKEGVVTTLYSEEAQALINETSSYIDLVAVKAGIKV